MSSAIFLVFVGAVFGMNVGFAAWNFIDDAPYRATANCIFAGVSLALMLLIASEYHRD